MPQATKGPHQPTFFPSKTGKKEGKFRTNAELRRTNRKMQFSFVSAKSEAPPYACDCLTYSTGVHGTKRTDTFIK
jgi:hypothetical protein